MRNPTLTRRFLPAHPRARRLTLWTIYPSTATPTSLSDTRPPQVRSRLTADDNPSSHPLAPRARHHLRIARASFALMPTRIRRADAAPPRLAARRPTSMYARAQERMLQLRDMASRGMANLAASAAAPLPRARLRGPPSPRPKISLVGDVEPAVSSRGASVAELAERLDAAAAAAEILFDMREHRRRRGRGRGGGGDALPTSRRVRRPPRRPRQNRAARRRHQRTTPRARHRSRGVARLRHRRRRSHRRSRRRRRRNGRDGGEGRGAPPRAGGGDGVGVGGWRRDLATPPPATEAESAMADLLGGLDVGGPAPSSAPSPAFTPGDGYRPPTMDVGSPAPSDRPTTEAEEEAMIAAALAASLADAQPQEQSQHPPLHAQPQTRGGDLLDAFAPPPASPAPASASPRPAPSPAPGATAAPNLIDF